MARASVFAGLAGIVACGSFLAAEEKEPTASDGDGGGTPDSGVLDGQVVDGAQVDGPSSDSGRGKDAGNDVTAARVCAVGAPFVSRTVIDDALDLRSVRLLDADNHYYYSHSAGGGAGVDIGAALRGANDSFGTRGMWFSNVNVANEGQTIAAVTTDGKTLVFQSNTDGTLRIATRTNASSPFGNATAMTYTGVAKGTNATEPYLTRKDHLFFASGDLIYSGKIAGIAVDIGWRYNELGFPAGFPVPSDDELEIFFERAVTNQGQKVFHASRTSTAAPFTNVVALPAVPVNDPLKNQRVTWTSADACTLFFVESSDLTENGFKLVIAKRN